MQNLKEKESLKSIVEVLNRKNKELQLLFETSRFFSSTIDINELYDKLFDVLLNIVDFQDMFVARFNEKERKIKYIYLRSVLENQRIDVSVIPEIPLAPEGKGILSEAIRKNDTVVIHDYQRRLRNAKKFYVTNQGSLSESEIEKPYTIESAMIVPIKLNGKILGFITVMSKNKTEFNSENLHWIETVVNQASISNKNAILYDEAVKELEEKNTVETQLGKVLEERNLLHSEVLNRVKSNLKFFSSLLQFQADYVKDPVYLEYFKISQSRVHTLTLIEEKLYNQDNLSRVDFESFLYSLISYLYTHYEINPNRISTYINIRDVSLPIDNAITCALLISELLTNSLIHSFPEKKKGNITVEMFQELPGKSFLSVRDNGINFASKKSKLSSYSMVLVGMFVKDLNGTLEVDRKKGTKITVRF
jgi:two-component sensor histidine kinase